MEDIKIFEFFALGAALTIDRADTSDFGEDEIRTIACELSVKQLQDIHPNSLKIPKQSPIVGDIGINRSKETFYYQGNNWIGL